MSSASPPSSILLIGYGREGKSSEAFFKKNFPATQISIFDENIPEFSKQPNFQDFDLLIKSPGVPSWKIKNAPQDRISSQTQLFFEALPETHRARVIGISGSKGKSTTTKFTAELLKNAGHTVAIGGNFGVPLLDLLDDFLQKKYDYLVAELSSFQLEHLNISPGIAIFLSLFEDHVDHHGNFSNYKNAKTNLWSHQEKDDLFFVPATLTTNNEIKFPERTIFTPPLGADFFPAHSVFRASHLLNNFGTVFELAKILNVEEDIFRTTCAQFQPLPHRLETVATQDRVTFINDSIATSPSASMAGIKACGENLGSIIMGGESRNVDYVTYGDFLKSKNFFIIVIQSSAGDQLIPHLSPGQYEIVDSMQEAIQLGREKTPQGKICLLSPAAPSFDRYGSYEERGEDFKKYSTPTPNES